MNATIKQIFEKQLEEAEKQIKNYTETVDNTAAHIKVLQDKKKRYEKRINHSNLIVKTCKDELKKLNAKE